MKLLKQIKRKYLIQLITFLGFVGVAAFCLASCQPEKKYGPPPVREDIEQEMQESSVPNANDAASTNGEDALLQPKKEDALPPVLTEPKDIPQK